MKRIRTFLILFVFSLMTLSAVDVKAQCAMCTAAVETNNKGGAKTTHGLNEGIMYLLTAPYIAVAAIGFIWYKKYRRKNVNLNMLPEKLNLN